MSVASPTMDASAPARPLPERLADWRALAKPKIAAMALVTVALGFLAAGGFAEAGVLTLLHACVPEEAVELQGFTYLPCSEVRQHCAAPLTVLRACSLRLC